MGLNNLYLSLQAVSAKKGRDAKMDWEAIHGLMEDAIYGGRIDNAFDTRVLRSYLRYGSFAQTRMEWAALLTLCVAVIACCSVFFSDRLAAEGSSGKEVLQGTPLLMPSNPDFKSFSRLIAQVPQPDLLSMWRQVYSSLLSYICSPSTATGRGLPVLLLAAGQHRAQSAAHHLGSADQAATRAVLQRPRGVQVRPREVARSGE
jgi:hypothetical protein